MMQFDTKNLPSVILLAQEDGPKSRRVNAVKTFFLPSFSSAEPGPIFGWG